MMNRLFTSFVALALGISGVGAWADDDGRHRIRDRDSQYTGTFEGAFGLEGILRRCDTELPGLPTRLVVRASYSKLAGVCDDQSNRPCAGRLLRLTERCFADQIVYPIDETAARVSVEHRVRICYNESASGHCDDVDAVAAGVWYTEFTSGFFNNVIDADPTTLDESAVGYDRELIKWSKPFHMDGRRVRVPRGVAYGESAARLDTECLFVRNACPQTGRLLRD